MIDIDALVPGYEMDVLIQEYLFGIPVQKVPADSVVCGDYVRAGSILWNKLAEEILACGQEMNFWKVARVSDDPTYKSCYTITFSLERNGWRYQYDIPQPDLNVDFPIALVGTPFQWRESPGCDEFYPKDLRGLRIQAIQCPQFTGYPADAQNWQVMQTTEKMIKRARELNIIVSPYFTGDKWYGFVAGYGIGGISDNMPFAVAKAALAMIVDSQKYMKPLAAGV